MIKKNGVFINLDRSPERRAHMEQQLERLGMSWVKRFPAIDGRKLQRPPACKVTVGEYAAFLSHVEAIESQPDDSFTFVFEDDVEFSEDLPLVLHDAQLEMLGHYDIILLDCQPDWHQGTMKAVWQTLSRQMHDPTGAGDRRVKGVEIYPAEQIYCWGLQAYVITPRGHKNLPPVMRECIAKGPPGPNDILIAHATRDGRLKGGVLVPFLATPQLESHTVNTQTERKQDTGSLALVSAMRRLYFAGPLGELFEYAKPLLEPIDGVSPAMDLAGRLAGQVFALQLRDGEIIIG